MPKIKGLELEHKIIIDHYTAFSNPAIISEQVIGDKYFHQLTPLGKYYFSPSYCYITLINSGMKLAIEFITTDPNVKQLENIKRDYQYADINLFYNRLTFLGNTAIELGGVISDYKKTVYYEAYLFNSYDFLKTKFYYNDFSKILNYSPYTIKDNNFVLHDYGNRYIVKYDVTKLYKSNIFKTDVCKCVRYNGFYVDYDYYWETDINEIIFPHGLKKEHLHSFNATHLELLYSDYPPIHPIDEVPEFKKSVWLNVNSYNFIKDNKIYIYFPKDWQSYPNQYGWRYIEVEYYEYIIPFGARCCLAECFGITE